MYPYDNNSADTNSGIFNYNNQANQAFKPRPTQFGGNSSGMAGINSMVSALSGIQDRYNQYKKMQAPGQPMVNGQPWQPAPREGSPNVFQGAPNMGTQSGMPSAPPTGVMPPTQSSMMSPTSPVPFQGMSGPGMGGFGSNGQGQVNPLAALFSQAPQGGY